MDELIAWYSRQVDADEAAAKANIGDGGLADAEEYGPGWPDYQTYDDDAIKTAQEFINHFRPLRMLREVAAKRARLERYVAQVGYHLPEGVHDGRDPDEAAADELIKAALETEVREDAAVYSDCDGYRQEWAVLKLSPGSLNKPGPDSSLLN